DEQRRRQDAASSGDQSLAAPPLCQVEGGQVETERQDRQHEAELSQPAHEGLKSRELTGAHQDELARGLHGLAAEQGVDSRLERGERSVELLDVRLARIL